MSQKTLTHIAFDADQAIVGIGDSAEDALASVPEACAPALPVNTLPATEALLLEIRDAGIDAPCWTSVETEEHGEVACLETEQLQPDG